MNKKFYSFGMATMMLLLSGNVMATDYYISANGSDTNDGKSAATPLKTLTALMPKVAQNKDGEHVYVSGIIKVDAEWTKAHLKNVIFEGANPETDGFDAEGKSSIFHINNSDCTFKNLSFRNGYRASADPGAGAIYGEPLRLTLDNCIFENNNVDNNNANRSAGAVFVNQTKTARGELAGVFATNTKFINNTTKAGGGAIVAITNIVDLKNCSFLNNTADNTGGAIYANQVKAFNIDACAFVGNQTLTSTGGAVNLYIKDQTNLTCQVSNSTFYQNKAQGNGGAFYWNQSGTCTGNTMNFVHCTVVENSTVGTVGHSGGVNIDNRTCTVNVVNSLIQGNLSEANQNSYADVAFGSTTVNFIGSYVGYVRKYADNDIYYSISSSSNVNNLDGNDPRKDESKALLAYADYVESLHFFPLKSTSDATIDGDATADAEYGVTKDQLGNAWPEYPYVGSVQLTDEDVAAGISGIKTDAPKSLKGIYNIAGQYVGNDAFKLAKGLYIIGGKKVVVK